MDDKAESNVVREYRQADALGKLGCEGFDGAADVARKLRQQWDDRLVLGRTDLVNHYLRAKLSVRAHFTLLGFEPREYAAICNTHLLHDHHPPPARFNGGFELEFTYAAAEPNARDDKQTVLVGVVQFLKHPKGIELSVSPSVKRLEGMDAVPGGAGDPLYHGINAGFVSVKRGVDWKPGPDGRFSVGLLDQLPHQEIQSGTQLVDDFANYDADPSGDRWGRTDKNQIETACFGVVLAPNFLGVRCTKGFDRIFHLNDVMIGPFDLLSATV